MALGERLQEIRKAIGISQGTMAVDLEITQASLSRYEKGKVNPPWDFVAKISDMYGISGTWLLSGKGEMHSEDVQKPPPSHSESQVINAKGFDVSPGDGNLIELPISGVIAAGHPIENHSLEPLGNVQIALPDPQNYVAFKVQGDSMTPQIEPDDVVLIRLESNWRTCEGKVCAVQADYELTLKRLLIDKRTCQVVLLPFNKLHDPIIIDPESTDVRIIGALSYLVRRF